MPEPLLRAAIGDQRISGWRQIYELGDAFDVSVSAMRYRLEGLNLVYVDRAGIVHASREEGTGQKRLLP
jgi:hypothetical protein